MVNDFSPGDEISNEIFGHILDNLDACIYATDMETDEILFINERMKREFGITGEATGKLCWQLLQSGFTERCSFCSKEKLLQNPDEAVVWEEHNTVTKRYYRNTDKIIDWHDGRKAHIQYSADITDIKRAEERIKSAERTLRAVLDTIPIPIFWKDENLTILGCNRSFAAAHGLDADELIGMNDHDFLDEVSASFNDANDRRVLETGEVYDKEERVVVRGNEERVFQVVKAPINDASADLPFALIGVTKDITGEKSIQRELERMSSIVENSTQYIAYINVKGMFDYFNPATLEVTGYSREELLDSGIHILYDKATMERVRNEILPNIFSQGRYDFDIPLIRKNGEVRHMSFSGFLVGDGEFACATIASDITDRKQLEEQLISEREHAENANRAKTDFLSRMSHEIRTPMNAIIGMTKIATMSSDDQKRLYCLEKIDAASTHLLRIINDILDMSKIEADKFELEEQPFNLERMITEAVGVVTFLCDEKEQNLVVRLDDDLPARIISDEMRLKQVITNLLSNAIKFTSNGGTITLDVTATAKKDGAVSLRFNVADNGIGIAEDKIANLFSAFEQGDGSITRRYGGTGLGLTICKKIVELMGGRIWAESRIGQGSDFIFTFDAKTDGEQRCQKPSRAVHILAIDDAEEIRNYFTHVMGGFGIPCDIAADGPTALELVRKKLAVGITYDVIFVDWKMPGMNGIEVTKKLRELVGEGTIIIMISIFEWDKIEQDALAAGVNKFVPKPLFSSALLDAVNDTLEMPVAVRSTTDAPEHDFSRYTILLAEDIEINQEIIATVLEDTGIKLDCASNGAEAIEKLRQQRYDLILMDIHMPVMDGFDATEIIRRENKSIPIVAMTANVFVEDIEKCLACGMNDHIAKPIERAVLLEKLAKYLNGVAKASAPEAPTELEDINMDMDYSAYVNAEEGATRVLNNKKLYFKLLGDCKVGEHSAKLADAIGAGDNDAVIHNAHTIKGISANLSLTALFALTAEIEATARAGGDVSGRVPELLETAGCTEAAIAQLLRGA